jgi:cardiolipin synthase A/B
VNFKFAAVIFGASTALVFGISKISSRTAMPSVTLSACTSCTLITEPDDGITPLLNMVAGASSSVDLVMYELDDPQIESALANTEKRGDAVRVLLNDGYQGEPDVTTDLNSPAISYLRSHGISVHAAPSYFDLTHQKTLVVDAGTNSAAALIMSFNLVSKYYPTGRDFGVVDTNAQDVAQIESVFEADWSVRNNFQNADGHAQDLVWSPGSRDALLSIINSASTSLDIYNEEMADPEITSALQSASKRGISVRVLMTYSPEWQYVFEQLTSSGAQIRTYDPNASLYIHAKVIVADDARAFVGSENFSAASLDDNRELGIVIAGDAITPLNARFEEDWQNATVFSG